MNKRRVFLPIIVLMIFLLGAGALVSLKKPPEKKEEVKKPLLVEVQPVVQSNVTYTIQSQGTVAPNIKTNLVSQVSGKILEVSPTFVNGGFFKKGDILVRLEQSDYSSAVKSAEAVLAQAKAALVEERARAKVAEKEWRSFMKGEAPTLYLRKPQLAREYANVRSAEANLEKAQRDLERTVIAAPIDGLVKSKHVDIGQFVTAGQLLANIYGTAYAEVRLPVTDQDLAFINLPKHFQSDNGPLVTLKASISGKSHEWSARVTRSEGTFDEKSRVMYLVAQVKDPYQLTQNGHLPLQYGRFVQAKIEGAQVNNIVVLPRHVLKSGNRVLLVDEESRLRIRQVEVARTDQRHVYIHDGLSTGDKVAISAIANPLEGMEVRMSHQDKKEISKSDKRAIAARGSAL